MSNALPNSLLPADVARIAEAWGKGKQRGYGDQWYTCCPVHDDKNASLSLKWVSGDGEGMILMCCHVGCTYDDLRATAEAQGLLEKWHPNYKSNDNYLEKAENDGLRLLDIYEYRNEKRQLEFQKLRFLDLNTNKKTFKVRRKEGGCWKYRIGARKVLYRLPELLEDIEAGKTIFLVEGEKDVNKARADGLAATCNYEGACSGNKNWDQSYSEYLSKAKRVVIIADNDFAGYDHLNAVARNLTAFDLQPEWLVMPGVPEHGDYSDWREYFEASSFQAVLDTAVPWTENVPIPYPDPKIKITNPDGSNVVQLHPEQGDKLNLEFIEKWTDTGNGARFQNLHGDNVRYTVATGWHIWTGTRFERDKRNQIKELAKEVARSMSEEGSSKKLQKWLAKSLNENGLNNMLSNAKSLGGIAVEISEFDKNDLLLNTLDGVVDLTTGELKPHERSFLFSKITACGFDPNAFSVFSNDDFSTYHELMPAYMDCMAWICGKEMDLEKLHYLQEVAGACLSGEPAQEAWLCEGGGRNLKSTWIDTLRNMMGDYATTISGEMFMRRQNADNQMYNPSQLLGVRLAAVEEINSDACLDEAKFKTLTGGSDEISARLLHHEAFKFVNKAKILMRSQHLPRIRNQDDGIWRRLRRIPFHTQVPESAVIEHFDQKLKAEWSVICAFFVRGSVRKRLRGRFEKPQCVLNVDAEYRSEMDIIGSMIEECFVPCEGYELSAAEVQRVHRIFCDQYNLKQMSMIELGRRLAQKNVIQKRTNKNGRVYVGYEISPAYLEQKNPRYSSRGKDNQD